MSHGFVRVCHARRLSGWLPLIRNSSDDFNPGLSGGLDSHRIECSQFRWFYVCRSHCGGERKTCSMVFSIVFSETFRQDCKSQHKQLHTLEYDYGLRVCDNLETSLLG